MRVFSYSGCTLDNEKDAQIVDAYVNGLNAKIQSMLAYLRTTLASIEKGNIGAISTFLAPNRMCTGPDTEQTIWNRNVDMANAFEDEIVVNNGDVFVAVGMLHMHDCLAEGGQEDLTRPSHQLSVPMHMQNKGFVIKRIVDHVFVVEDAPVNKLSLIHI